MSTVVDISVLKVNIINISVIGDEICAVSLKDFLFVSSRIDKDNVF